MLELICQQRYREQGIPVDISLYRNHGTAIGRDYGPGTTPGHDAISMSSPMSRVHIGLGTLGAWRPLTALKIEIDVKLNPAAGLVLPLVEGDGSFQFLVNQRAPAASVAGAGGASMYVRADGPFAPDGKLHEVPANRWTTLGFEHDGYAWMRLYIDGRLVGSTSVNQGVPPVQAGGVTVGNSQAGGQPLLGSIDELRIWRDDRNAMKREFLCRPYTQKTARCWDIRLRAIAEWFAKHPYEGAALAQQFEDMRRNVLHTLLSLPLAEKKKLRALAKRYEVQWCRGHIASPEMGKVFAEFMAVLKKCNLLPSDPRWNALRGLLEEMNQAIPDTLSQCDPAVRAITRHLQKYQKGGE